MFTKEKMEELHNNIKLVATKQMIELIEFYETNQEYFRHNSLSFIPDRGYYFKEVTIRENKLLATFVLQGWEHNSIYCLDMDNGYVSELARMKQHIKHTKLIWAEEAEKEALARKAQYEELRKEFE